MTQYSWEQSLVGDSSHSQVRMADSGGYHGDYQVLVAYCPQLDLLELPVALSG